MVWWPGNFHPSIQTKAFFQIAATGSLWKESRKENPHRGAGPGYIVGTAFLWMPPVMKKLVVWNPVTKYYLAAAVIGTGISGLIWGREGIEHSLDFYTDPKDIPSKTVWAVNYIDDLDDPAGASDTADLFWNTFGMRTYRQRQEEGGTWNRGPTITTTTYTQDAITIHDLSKEQQLELGFITPAEYTAWFNVELAKVDKKRRIKSSWDAIPKEGQIAITETRAAYQRQMSAMRW